MDTLIDCNPLSMLHKAVEEKEIINLVESSKK